MNAFQKRQTYQIVLWIKMNWEIDLNLRILMVRIFIKFPAVLKITLTALNRLFSLYNILPRAKSCHRWGLEVREVFWIKNIFSNARLKAVGCNFPSVTQHYNAYLCFWGWINPSINASRHRDEGWLIKGRSWPTICTVLPNGRT